MKRILLALLAVWLQVAAAMAGSVELKDDVPARYTVKAGDTLWEISTVFLKKPWQWPEIWQANPQIANPQLIYPGDVIALTYVDGQPHLTLERSGQPAEHADGRTVVLRPQVRVSPHENVIPALPLGVVNSFLSRTRIVEAGDLENAPYVLAGHEKRLISGMGDDFFARGVMPEGEDFLGIYRKGDPYIDPDTQELLGLRAEDIGSAQVKRVSGEVATLKTTRSVREIRVGDRLLSHEERRLKPAFYPQAPDVDIKGKIVSVEGGVSQVGHLDVVAINRGERDGLQSGDVLGIFKQGETVHDRLAGEQIVLPSERAGLLMVFRSFEKMSFGLVMHADRPLAVGDEIANP
ncbi:MAG: LysM peptidoglycan-binding domain-containing protein [Porticoccaceae bacterium]|nr:LysM peptidoglycan-binding domain-containing protein [Porticoccaceae bacterium]